MKTLTAYKLLTLVLAITLLFSCHDDEFLDTPQAKTPETSDVQAIENDILPQIKLGKKLENPYSVTNMKKALESLNNKQLKKTTSTSKGNVGTLTTNNYDIDIEPTHLYVNLFQKVRKNYLYLKAIAH